MSTIFRYLTCIIAVAIIPLLLIAEQRIFSHDNADAYLITELRWGNEKYDISPGKSMKNAFLPFVFAPKPDFGLTVRGVNFDGAILGGFFSVSDDTLSTVLDERQWLPEYSGHRELAREIQWSSSDELFVNCSFKNTKFLDSPGFRARNCNFEDAVFIRNCGLGGLQKKDMQATLNYKKYKNFSTCNFTGSDVPALSFSKFNLLYTRWYQCKLMRCDFSGADLRRSELDGCDVTDADFTDTRISHCTFAATNIAIAQIKQTWNYKTGNMTGIKLPPEIQKALDEEKKNISPPR